MATLDARGAQLDVPVLASAGWYSTLNVEASAGVARDLTGETLTLVVKDDEADGDSYNGVTRNLATYTLTVSDAANGVAKIAVPPAIFSNKEGNQLSYELSITNTSSEKFGLIWGYFQVQERG